MNLILTLTLPLTSVQFTEKPILRQEKHCYLVSLLAYIYYHVGSGYLTARMDQNPGIRLPSVVTLLGVWHVGLALMNNLVQ